MSRLTYKSESGMTWFVDEEGRRLEPCEMSPHHSRLAIEKLAHYEDLEEQGELLNTHQVAVILAEAFGYEHPCNFNGNDEWFSEVCDLGELCPDGKMSAIACWEQYIKVKLAEM